MITPAIWALSAVGGLTVVNPDLTPMVLMIAIVVPTDCVIELGS